VAIVTACTNAKVLKRYRTENTENTGKKKKKKAGIQRIQPYFILLREKL